MIQLIRETTFSSIICIFYHLAFNFLKGICILIHTSALGLYAVPGTICISDSFNNAGLLSHVGSGGGSMRGYFYVSPLRLKGNVWFQTEPMFTNDVEMRIYRLQTRVCTSAESHKYFKTRCIFRKHETKESVTQKLSCTARVLQLNTSFEEASWTDMSNAPVKMPDVQQRQAAPVLRSNQVWTDVNGFWQDS